MAEPVDVVSFPLVAVAVDKDKSSQGALKWALDNVVSKGQTIILVHVVTKLSSGGQEETTSAAGKEVLFPFRCFCRRKDINCIDIVLEDTDVPKAIVHFVEHSAVEKLVVGSSRGGFVRSFRSVDISTQISKSMPDFCTVYIIHKGKTSSVKNATRPAPTASPLRTQIQSQATRPNSPADNKNLHAKKGDAAVGSPRLHSDLIRSPFSKGAYSQSMRPSIDTISGIDISFVSNNRPSTDQGFSLRMSHGSDSSGYSFESVSPHRSSDYSAGTACSSISYESFESDRAELVEAEMNRLRLELKQTMHMYSAACKEAITAKNKVQAMELQCSKRMEERQRVKEAQTAEESALTPVAEEKATHLAAYGAGEVAKWSAEKIIEAEKREIKLPDENGMTNFNSFPEADLRLNYRKYAIEEIQQATDHFAVSRKIGEGGYGAVFKCYLDHTPVAVKVLRPDVAQGKSQFQQEVQVLSCVRHPNMVCLIGACPEYCCLVYEYMANGSLEDRLFMQDNTPPIPWQYRFCIAAEIATCLLFLHQTKPEPLVHRDLKPANILLDQNYRSKISDVGLARLVPPKIADQVTQYRITSAAGTFCYIDPEYQQTGQLGTKSDIYSFGVLLLQLLTGKPPMGLAHLVDCAIEKGIFAEVLDPTVQDWPVEEALIAAKMALRCTELRRKDRPDLGKVIMPELDRLRDLSETNMNQVAFGNSFRTSPAHSQVSAHDISSGSSHQQSGNKGSREYSGSSS